MIEITKPIRAAYLEKSRGNIFYDGVGIPIDSDYLLSEPAELLPGNHPSVFAWIILQNQTVNDASLKCSVNQNSAIQVDIVTQFPANSGSYDIANDIANNFLETILPDGSIIDLEIPGLNVWRAWVDFQQLITEDNRDNRIFRHIIGISHSVNQI